MAATLNEVDTMSGVGHSTGVRLWFSRSVIAGFNCLSVLERSAWSLAVSIDQSLPMFPLSNSAGISMAWKTNSWLVTVSGMYRLNADDSNRHPSETLKMLRPR